MRNGMLWLAIVVLLGVIGVLSWLLVKDRVQWAATPPEPSVASSTPPINEPVTPATTESSAPLSSKVQITSPVKGATVGSDFTITGSAPGPWYFEASFPISVRDPEGNVLGVTHANAQGEWMTTSEVAFTATMHLEAYSGPATLILLKDNPSGLPENDDSTEIPITVKQ